MFWQLQGLFFSSLSTLPYASSHRGDPKPLQNIPECKAFAMSHSCRGGWRGLLQTGEREWGRRGRGGSCRACVKGWTRKEEWQHWLKGGRKPPGKSVQGLHSSEDHLFLHGLELPALLASSLSPIHFPGKSNLDCRGLQVSWRKWSWQYCNQQPEGAEPTELCSQYTILRHSLKCSGRALFLLALNRGGIHWLFSSSPSRHFLPF